MSSNQYVYQLGVTTVTLGATAQLIKFGSHVNGFKLQANASMYIVNALGASYPLDEGVIVNNDLEIMGPAQFYLGGSGTADFIVYKSANDDIY